MDPKRSQPGKAVDNSIPPVFYGRWLRLGWLRGSRRVIGKGSGWIGKFLLWRAAGYQLDQLAEGLLWRNWQK
jgi:hypothetical protein